MRKIIIIIICIISILLACNLAQGIGGGGWVCAHFDNPTPSDWEMDVEIGPKGVQTCINITIDQGCTANVTFQWFNWIDYYDDWSDWLENPVGDTPSFFNDSYWHNYSSWTSINASTMLCAWNANVSCHTEGAIPYFDWRVIGNFTCGNTTYNETCYYYFYPEDCPLFYIYPSWNATNICPCCDGMCIGVTNELGHNMNITIYRNDTLNETFYMVNKYINISNGTYCFCIDGHVDDMYYPMKYNETYHWYVNVTDASTGEYNVSNIFSFRTAENLSNCFCGNLTEALTELDIYPYYKAFVIGLLGLIGLAGLKKYKRRRKE